MAGVKETCLGLGEDLPLESRLWVLLPGDEGMGRELETGVRAMGVGGGREMTAGECRVQRPGREGSRLSPISTLGSPTGPQAFWVAGA